MQKKKQKIKSKKTRHTLVPVAQVVDAAQPIIAPYKEDLHSSSFTYANIKLLYKDLAKTVIITCCIFSLLVVLYLRG